MRESVEQTRAAITVRLRSRRAEIEQAALTRAYAVSEPSATADPEYAEGLRAAVAAAVDYGLSALERGEERAPPIPTALLSQARLAARNAVGLDTVLRRYFAGFALLGDFVIEEAERGGIGGEQMKRLLGAQAALFDRLLAALSEEYGHEERGRLRNAEERRAERVQRLLSGQQVETSELAYELDAQHLGAIAAGPGAGEAIRGLATALDRHLLLIQRGGTVWAWLGSRQPLDPADLEHRVSRCWPGQVALAVGEPGEGLAGWRLTHQQARAALPIALRRQQTLVRYADVALLASLLQDDVLATSLRQLYLEPLTEKRDGGAALRRTLRAYFAAERNVSSTASALGVNRRTVTNRLHAVEERLGRSLSVCAAEMEAALRLEDLREDQAKRAAASGSPERQA